MKQTRTTTTSTITKRRRCYLKKRLNNYKDGDDDNEVGDDKNDHNNDGGDFDDDSGNYDNSAMPVTMTESEKQKEIVHTIHCNNNGPPVLCSFN